jgi:hypothetical protein
MRLYNKVVNQALQSAAVINTATQTPGIDLSGARGFCIIVNVTATSTPSGASVQLQASNDGVTWANVGTSTAISATGVLAPINIDAPYYAQARLSYAIASGSITVTSSVIVKALES